LNILKFLTELTPYTLCHPSRSLFPSFPSAPSSRKPMVPLSQGKWGNTLHYFENYRLSRVLSTAVARSQGSRNSTIATWMRLPYSKFPITITFVSFNMRDVRSHSYIFINYLYLPSYSKNISKKKFKIRF